MSSGSATFPSRPQWWRGPIWLLFFVTMMTPAALFQTGCGGSSSPASAVTTTGTSLSLAANPSSIAATASTTLSVTLTEANTSVAAPTGSVSILGSSGAVVGAMTLVADATNHSSTAKMSVSGSALTAGSNALTAKYAGDSLHEPSTGAVTVVVAGASAAGNSATTAALSVQSPNIPTGGTAVFTGTISQMDQSKSVAPTGKLSFVDLTSGSKVIATATLTDNGNGSSSASASVSASAFASGTNLIEVTYPGDANFAGSTSGSTAITADASLVSAAAAARFLDQSSFGPTQASIAQVQKLGLPGYLSAQFTQVPTLYSEPPNPAPSQCPTYNFKCTQSDFVTVSVFGQDQLRQRVAMALSEMWVASPRFNNSMPFYLNTIAADAFTNYRSIMNDLTLSPAMGEYLNMINSAKPVNGEIANENYAREIMQLFTLGLDMLNQDGTLQFGSDGQPIPVYTEAQVEAFARAYTGWTNANPDGSSPPKLTNVHNWNALMVPVEKQHDTAAKTLLAGVTLPAGQTAEQDLKGALDNIFAQPNVPPFVCRQLIQHLVTGNPSPAYVARISAVFTDNGSGVRGDMKAVITAILMDEEARANDAQTGDQLESSPAADGGHLREPLLWTAALLRAVSATQTAPGAPYPFVALMTGQLGNLGEAPFEQPSVFNFFSPEYSIPNGAYATGTAPANPVNAPEFQLEDTGSIVPRESMADMIVHNGIAGLTVDLSATSTIGGKASDPATLVDYLGMVLMHSQMPSDMRNILINAVEAIPSSDLQSRAQVAVFLVVTSPQYKNLH